MTEQEADLSITLAVLHGHRNELAIATALLMGAESIEQPDPRRGYRSTRYAQANGSGARFHSRAEAAIHFLALRGIAITHDCVVRSFKDVT